MNPRIAVWVQRGVIIAVVVVALALYAFAPAVSDAVNSVLAMFATGDFSAASEAPTPPPCRFC